MGKGEMRDLGEGKKNVKIWKFIGGNAMKNMIKLNIIGCSKRWERKKLKNIL